MNVYLTFDVVGDERPKVGSKLELLRISNDLNRDWFPNLHNYINYGKVVEAQSLPDENGELRTICTTRVTRKRYEKLISEEDFGEVSIRMAASSILELNATGAMVK